MQFRHIHSSWSRAASLLLAAGALLAACQQADMPRSSQRTTAFHLLNIPSSLATVDTAHVDALVALVGTRSFDLQGPADMLAASGFFADDARGVNVLATINGTPLPGGGLTGYYTGRLEPPIPATSAWRVEGYDGGSIADTAPLPPAIAFPRPSLDTISKSAGWTASYEGAAGGDLIVDFSFNWGMTESYVDPAIRGGTRETAARVNKGLTDAGAVTFTPNDLAPFPPNSIATLTVYHYNYHVAASTRGRKMGVLNGSGASISVYVKP